MGRPPSNGAPSFRFNPTEVAQMEGILQKHEGHVPPRDLLVALAERFSNSPDRAGKAVVVQMKQVWNWFQNRRYALRAKLVKSPGKPSTSPVTRDEVTPMRNVPSIPHQMAVSSGPHMIRNTSEAPQMEFEAKSARDGAWYDVQAFLSHRFLETGNPEVLVRFSGFGPEEDEWVNIRMHCRQRSLPCEASECIAVLPGDLILCFQEGKEQALYFDAHVFDAQRRRHDVRGCRCRFLVRYDHDQSEEIVQLRKICRRPETDYRLQLLHAANEAASTAVSAEQPTPVVDLTSSSPMKMSNPISSSAAIAVLPPPVGSGAGPFARPPAASQAPIPTLVRAPVPGSIVSSSTSPSPIRPLAASPSPIRPPAPSPSPIRPPAPSPSPLGPPAASSAPVGHSGPPGFPASVLNPAITTSVLVPTATGPGFPVSAPFSAPVSAHFSAPVTVAVPEAPAPAIEPKKVKSEIPAQVPVPEPQKVETDNPVPAVVPVESVGVDTEEVPVSEQMKVEPDNQAVSSLPMPEPKKVESEVPDQVSEPVTEATKIEGANIAPVSVPKSNRVETDNQVPVTEPNKVESDNQVPVPELMEVENENPVTVPEPMEVENENPVPVPEPIEVENQNPVQVPEPIEVEDQNPVQVPEPIEVENQNPVPVTEVLETANKNAVSVPKQDNVETVNLGTLGDEAGGQTNVTSPVAVNKVQESEEAENSVPAAELTGGSTSQGQPSDNPSVTVPGQEKTESSAPNDVALEGSSSAEAHHSTETVNSTGEH